MSSVTGQPRRQSLAPPVCVEIAPRRVTAVTIARRGDAISVAGYATQPLPEGAVNPSLTSQNILDRSAVVEALKLALAQQAKPRRICLVVPDSMAKVSLIRFEKVPERTEDLDQLVRWQVRKAAPFRIEEAQVTYTAGTVMPDGGREFIVAIARRDVVEEYETACAEAGVQAGLVDLATFNLVNLLLAQGGGDGGGDCLLVHVTPAYSTMAIVRNAELVFFRNRRAEGEGDLADMVHQTAMYYEDRLGGAGFGRIVLAGAAADGTQQAAAEGERMRRELELRVGSRVEPIDPGRTVTFPPGAVATPDVLDALASPLGLLLREVSV